MKKIFSDRVPLVVTFVVTAAIVIAIAALCVYTIVLSTQKESEPKEERFGIIWKTYYSEGDALDAAVYKACQIILDDFEIYLDE